MAQVKRSHFISLGPAIPIVPVSHFSYFPFSDAQWAKLWQVVGPSVQRNMNAGTPLWLIIAAAYAEGLHHGSAIPDSEGNVAKPEERKHDPRSVLPREVQATTDIYSEL